MKKHPTNEKTLHIIHHGNIYDIPKKVADKYKTGSVLADDLFAQLDDKYTKAGVLLQGLRNREGLSQIEFAKKINVSQPDLSKMELGKRSIGKKVAKRIEAVFKVNYRYFLE